MGLDYEKEAEKFSEIYADAVFTNVIKFSKLTEPLTYQLFYESVYDEASRRTGLAYEDIVHLSHPFHWLLFTGKIDSPLELVSASGPVSLVGIRRIPEPGNLAKEVMKIRAPMSQTALDELEAENKLKPENERRKPPILLVERYKARFNGTNTYRQ